MVFEVENLPLTKSLRELTIPEPLLDTDGIVW